MKRPVATTVACYVIFVALVLTTYFRLRHLVDIGKLAFDRTMIAMIVLAVLAFLFIRPKS